MMMVPPWLTAPTTIDSDGHADAYSHDSNRSEGQVGYSNGGAVGNTRNNGESSLWNTVMAPKMVSTAPS